MAIKVGRLRAIGILGSGLAVLVTASWLTAVPYLLVHLGKSSPVRMAVVDVVHLFVGVVFGAWLITKILFVGFAPRIAGVTETTLWQRWTSLSMIVLYGSVVATGALTLVGFSQPTRDELVNGHLIAAVWAAVPATWHVWHYRGRLLAAARDIAKRRITFAVVATVLVAAALISTMTARALSPTSQQGGGSAWVRIGPQVFLDRMVVTSDGKNVVAGGSGLFVCSTNLVHCHKVGPFSSTNIVLGLSLPASGSFKVLVGAVDGLYGSDALEGVYRRLPIPASDIYAAVVDPTDSSVIWVSSDLGMWMSSDGGMHFTQRNDGLARPQTAWSLTWWNGRLYGSTATGVFSWDARRWMQSNRQANVVSLDVVHDELFASSMGAGLERLAKERWVRSDSGILFHTHGSALGIHVVSISTGARGIRYAGTMISGIAVSTDAGRTWSGTWSNLSSNGVTWRVATLGNRLVVVTDQGMLTYSIPHRFVPDPLWWTSVLAGVIAIGLGSASVSAWAARRSA